MLKFLILAAALNLSAMNQQGSGTMSWAFWDAYKATLYTQSKTFNPNEEFALKLDYKVDIEGADIAERSIEEMEKQQTIPQEKSQKWLGEMKKIFPSVDDKTTITGVNIPNKGAAFYKNGKLIGEINDTEFAKRFFDIWLSPKTSEPKLRKQLLGEK
jgi:hypothetical protein